MTPRLLGQVRATIRARHYGRRTEESLRTLDPSLHRLPWPTPPAGLREEDIKAFMTWLAVDLGASAVTRDLDGLPPSTCTESVIQRAVSQAGRAAGLTKRVGRHMFGTPSRLTCSKAGQTSGRCRNSSGHADVSTSMIYTHELNRGGLGVKSPLDLNSC